MKESAIAKKSYDFSLQIIHLSRSIADKQKEYVLTKQLLKSGTSIGANVQEATEAQSRADFIAKLCIALKEAKEALYWLRLIRDSKLSSTAIINSQIEKCKEIKYILIASIKTARKNLK